MATPEEYLYRCGAQVSFRRQPAIRLAATNSFITPPRLFIAPKHRFIPRHGSVFAGRGAGAYTET
jgi:hypothetical protein